MPTDLIIDPDSGPVHVRDRAGVGLPFSKGIMATSILATGVPTDVAYRVAADIGRDLRAAKIEAIDADRLMEKAAEALVRTAGAENAGRYLAWRRVKRSGRPLILALAGASGVGKSTIATRLSLRLGINRVLTTDAIRDVLRTVIPETVLPELHISTYECAAMASGESAGLSAFHRQARAVASASVAVAARIATERRSVILEGVHLLPGHVREALAGHASEPIVQEMLLCLDDEAQHRARLEHRRLDEPGRGGDRHLRHLDSIRSIHEELRRLARDNDVPEHDVSHPEDITQRLVELTVGKLERTEGAR